MGIRERKQRERERRRQQILVAAKRVFSTKGFAGATMEDIAREAELSAGTLYLYFRNKDELFSSLFIRVLQYLNLRLEHVIATTADQGVEERLEALNAAMLDVYRFDPVMLVNLFHLQSSDTMRNLSEDLLEEIRNLSDKSLRTLAQVFEPGVREGRIRELPATVLADIAWALFSGVVLWEESKRMIDTSKEYLESTLETAFGIFIRGITVPGPMVATPPLVGRGT
jgi:AcrR family transcriptional regulator